MAHIDLFFSPRSSTEDLGCESWMARAVGKGHQSGALSCGRAGGGGGGPPKDKTMKQDKMNINK